MSPSPFFDSRILSRFSQEGFLFPFSNHFFERDSFEGIISAALFAALVKTLRHLESVLNYPKFLSRL